MNKIKGDIYEFFIKSFLNDNPKICDDICVKENCVWLWKELSEYQLFDCGLITSYNEHRLTKKSSENPLIDVGIDIIFKTTNENIPNDYIFVQCKNYQNTICVNDLAGFYMMMANHTQKKGIVFHSNPQISRNITYNHINKNIKYIHQPLPSQNTLQQNKKKISLYDYQKVAVKQLREFFAQSDNKRGILNYPCGTGKTLISYVFARKYKYIILIAPLKEFAQQNLTRYIQYGRDTFTPILIDSDGTRNIDDLTKNLDQNCVFSATYRSCDVIYELLKLLNPDDVMIIIDEFHNLSYKNIYGNFIKNPEINDQKEESNSEDNNEENEDECEKNEDECEKEENESESDKEENENEDESESDEENENEKEEDKNENEEDENENDEEDESEDLINIDPIYNILSSDFKILFLSATPRIYELEDNNEDDDIENILGKIVCKMSIKEAIENKYITDYKIYLPVFDDKNNTISDIEKELNCKVKELEFVNKCLFMFEAIKKFGNLKCIVYLRSHEEIINFEKCFKKLNEYYFYEYLMDNITCNDNQIQRKEKIKKFSEINNKPSFLLSVSILDECIDIKKCDCIFISYNSSSKIKNIQRLFRATRLDENNLNKFGKIFVWANEENENINFISSIKEYDEKFVEKVRYLESSNEIKSNSERKEKNKKLIEKNKIKLIGIKEYHAQNWHQKLELLIKFVEENKRKPTQHKSKKMEERKLGIWLSSQIQNYKKKTQIMFDKNIYNKFTKFLDDNKDLFKTNEEIWFEKFNKLKEFVNKNKKRPSEESKNIYEKNIGKWVSQQIKNYKKKSYVMKNKNVYKKFKIFLEVNKSFFMNNEEKWYDSFEKTKYYIEKNNKRPNQKESNDTKILGKWLSEQLKQYKRKIFIMKNEKIYNEFNKFLNTNINLFKTNEEKWYELFEKTKKYLNENKKRPSETSKNTIEKEIGIWLNRTNSNYKRRKKIMKNDDIYNTFKDFKEKYVIYF